MGIAGKGRAGREGVGRNGRERVREGWEVGGWSGRERERNGEKRWGKGREDSTYIFVQGPRVPSYAIASDRHQLSNSEEFSKHFENEPHYSYSFILKVTRYFSLLLTIYLAFNSTLCTVEVDAPRQRTVDRYAFAERLSVTLTFERMTFQIPEVLFAISRLS